MYSSLLKRTKVLYAVPHLNFTSTRGGSTALARLGFFARSTKTAMLRTGYKFIFFCHSLEGDIGGYPIPQYREKKWQIPKYRVENRLNTDTAYFNHIYNRLRTLWLLPSSAFNYLSYAPGPGCSNVG